jgi:SAM-dependent methyltransferase
VTSAVAERVAGLRAALEQADRRDDQSWVRSLDPRKREEIEFHDRDRTVTPEQTASAQFERDTANKKYYSTVEASRRYMRGWIEGHCRDAVVLDYACGAGHNTISAARAGAALAVGLDISRVSVEASRRRAEAAGVGKRTCFVQGDCEDTRLPSNSFDIIFCMGMLHHLDLGRALPEMRRILRPGGRCLAVEALNYNPVIKLYRWLTPGMRTDWERRHILSLADLRFARRFFEVRDIRYWHLFSVLATPLRKTRLFRPALALAGAVDRVALRVPGLAQMAWMFSFELVKPLE